MPAKSGKQLKDIYWVAGILEGEGSFICTDKGTAPCIKLGMVDLDIIYRFQLLTNSNGIREEKLSSGKIFYITLVTGEDAIGWMMTIYNIMGKRRKAQIKNVLSLWSNFKPKEHRVICKRGHTISGHNAIKVKGSTSYACRMCKNINTRNFKLRRKLNACA